ncbi:phytoene desaturase family protein [Pontibacter silvestris]|uniref:Phytoene desaturase family protein n=1 Tax=Pontibacter silvestris TaxID=2305183 RepID=A0ABW4WWC6_9BACT|nr:NAD(P)/FAD-dependent oxidoreductase [Pontibacter silvestris]MCC9137401.1 NAD(P)/FAD-dependent oxidoreductase [Pontibacter silvestris]
MKYDVILVGSGFGSLTAAALLAKHGLKACVLEQAKYPGGCATSYKRKSYWFETGATTLVGLDDDMPLRYLLDETKIEVPVRKLNIPMQVHLPDGLLLTRYQKMESWILEVERVFGKDNQRSFWEHCYQLSRKVWRISTRQTSFPPSNFSDFCSSALKATPGQLSLLSGAFRTMDEVLRKYNLHQNKLFVDFINEQLLITAQNYAPEVNELFGATALCYTLYSNYYVDGGLINLVQPIVDYINEKGGAVLYRQEVREIVPDEDGYLIKTNTSHFKARFVVSGIPLNNTYTLFKNEKVKQRLLKYIMPSSMLNSAFTMNLLLKGQQVPEILHHQIHVPEQLSIIGSKSIFVSFSHPQDKLKGPVEGLVVSISTHVFDPENNYIHNKREIEKAIIELLVEKELIKQENITYTQSATPGAWIFWTNRIFGAVGGYPQYKHIKPWQMKDARLDQRGAYVCGDTVYPGQGVPGACLSGIIAASKLLQDHY